MARSLFSLSALKVLELRELLARSGRVAAASERRLSARGSVGVLCQEPRPFARAAIEAGLARLGLSASVYGPAEVAALGDDGPAGAIGIGMPGAVLVGFSAERAAAVAASCPCPVLACDGAAGDPVGALADLIVLERALPFRRHRLAVVGDASARALDLAVAVASLGGSVSFAHPVGFAPDPERLTLVRDRAAAAGGAVLDTTELIEGLRDATAVVVEPIPAGEGERFRAVALQRHQLRVVSAGAGILHRAPERRGAEMSASLAEEGQFWAADQRAAGPIAAATLLGMLLESDPLRSVIG